MRTDEDRSERSSRRSTVRVAARVFTWCLLSGLVGATAACGSSGDAPGDDPGDGGDATSDDATGDGLGTDGSRDTSGGGDTTTPPTDGTADTVTMTDSTTGGDSTAVDSGTTDTAGGVDTKPPPDVGPTFTVKIATPAPDAVIHFIKSDTCQFQRFTVAANAPAGIKKVFWKFITPTTGTGATCGGGPAYGYPMDLGTTTPLAASFSEDVAISGLYPGPGGALWWWCTKPGTGGTAAVGPPLPATGAPTQGLDRYCWSATAEWQLQVTVTDTTGAAVTDTLKFFVETP